MNEDDFLGGGSSEKAIMNDTLMLCSALPETLLYRQNTGQAWQGKRVKAEPGTYVRMEPGMVILRGGRPINFGLEGAGDVVGTYQGRPVQIELKTEIGQQRIEQKRFQLAWQKAGGIYILARSARAALTALKNL